MYISEDWRSRLASVSVFFSFFFSLLFEGYFALVSSFSRLPEQLPLLREFSNFVHHLLSLRSPLFIASLRHGHEVGGDAVSEVKTILASAIGQEM